MTCAESSQSRWAASGAEGIVGDADTLGGRLARLGVPPLQAALGQRVEVDVVQGGDQDIRLGGGE